MMEGLLVPKFKPYDPIPTPLPLGVGSIAVPRILKGLVAIAPEKGLLEVLKTNFGFSIGFKNFVEEELYLMWGVPSSERPSSSRYMDINVQPITKPARLATKRSCSSKDASIEKEEKVRKLRTKDTPVVISQILRTLNVFFLSSLSCFLSSLDFFDMRLLIFIILYQLYIGISL